MTIEKLHIMPAHEKVEDGYAYNSKYIGNVYQLNDQLVYFKEKSTIEYPMKVVQAIKSETLEAVDLNLQSIYETISSLEDKITNLEDIISKLQNNNDIKEYIDSNLVLLNNKIEKEIKPELLNIDTLSDNLATINSEVSKIRNEMVTKLDLVQTIDKIIDQNLTVVYNNFDNVTRKLVTDAITEALKDSKRDQSGKLKITTLMMLKEMGLSPDEIIKYSESGLV